MHRTSQSKLRIFLILNIVLLLYGLVRLSFHQAIQYDHRASKADSDRARWNRYGAEKSRRGLKLVQENAKDTLSEPRNSNVIIPSFAPINRYNASVGISKELLVPNIVHYIWYSTEQKPLRFHHMLCMLSAYKFIQPDVMYFHTNLEPVGKYWKRILKLPKLKVYYRQPPTVLYGKKIKKPTFYTSHSNIDRIKILMEYGGIYLDFDVLVTRPFDDLRRYPCTIGREQETKACSSVIVCAKDSPFLLLWINSYLDDYQEHVWAYNSGQVPFNLAQRFPHLVNMDENRINRPNYKELQKIIGPDRFNWQHNYAVHLWHRLWRDKNRRYYSFMEPNEENIKTLNSTFGEMARAVLYGSKELMHAN